MFAFAVLPMPPAPHQDPKPAAKIEIEEAGVGCGTHLGLISRQKGGVEKGNKHKALGRKAGGGPPEGAEGKTTFVRSFFASSSLGLALAVLVKVVAKVSKLGQETPRHPFTSL